MTRDVQNSKELSTYAVLSSQPRQKILSILTKGNKSVEELANEVKLETITVRYHLKALMNAGLVEELHERGKRRRGRYPTLYKLSERVSINFPKRQYMLLSDLLIQGLLASMGEEQAHRILLEVGKKSGVEMGETLMRKHGISRWTPELFKKHFVEGLLVDFGVEAETLKLNDSEIIVREYTCPFLELALKHPSVVCDALDRGLHQGLRKVLGRGSKIDRLRCQGHGDPYCEYHVKLR